tara:strand:- start:1188 stop:1358 length:171 start_codon:yes stop_codon:yes gene_type:complete
LEAKLSVETGTLRSHQIYTFDADNGWSVQELFDHPPAETMALEIARHDNVPEHCAA